MKNKPIEKLSIFLHGSDWHVYFYRGDPYNRTRSFIAGLASQARLKRAVGLPYAPDISFTLVKRGGTWYQEIVKTIYKPLVKKGVRK